MLSLGSYPRTVQEPSTPPDFTGMDSPQELIAEACQRHGIAVAAFLAAMDNMASDGLLRHLPGFHDLTEALPRILAMIGDGPNCGLRAWCIDFVAGSNIFDIHTETDISRRWGCTRAAANRFIQELRGQLGIEHTAGCRPESTRKTYAARAKQNHAEGKIRKPQRVWITTARTQWTKTLTPLLTNSR